MREKANKTALDFDIDDVIPKYIEYFKNAKIQEVSVTDVEKKEAERWIVKEDDIFNPKVNKDYVSNKRKMYWRFLGLFPKGLKTKVKNILQRMINS